MKNNILLILIIFLVPISLSNCTNGSSNKTTTSGSSVNQNLFAAAKEINKKCPITVDETTRMDSASVYNEYMITYHYTVHTVDNKDVDLKKFKTSMETSMKEKYQTDPQLAIYRDNKIAIAYNYKDKAGGYLCYFIVGEK